MLYFIHSPKQTSYSGIDQYWKANENGYTSVLANAGVYTEEDKKRIEKRSNEWGATFIQITPELIQKAKEQLDDKLNACYASIKQENIRHAEEIRYIDDNIYKYSAMKNSLKTLEQETIQNDYERIE